MNNSNLESLNDHLKMYAVISRMTMREVRAQLAAVLGISTDMTYKYSKGTSKMDVAKIRQTVVFLSQYIPVTEEKLTEWFYPTPVEEFTQAKAQN